MGIDIRYRDNGTPPWSPFASMTVSTESATEKVGLPAGQELAPLIARAMRDAVVDFAEAVRHRRAPAAPGCRRLVHARDRHRGVRIGRHRRNRRAAFAPNERTDERAWNYVAVGTGHPDGPAFWARFADGLQAAGYHGPLSIENEDYTLGQRESVATAVGTLRQVLAAKVA